jgi:UDP-N-acetyl-D-galactosamine dehydrogenase
MPNSPRIAVIGLGYVGLPLAIGLTRHFSVIGFDTSKRRIAELREHHDRTGEVDDTDLRSAKLALTDEVEAMRGAGIFIITVPTPVTLDNAPDLAAVRAACRSIGQVIGKGSIVTLESTVYPGVTEDICGPEIAAVSGLVPGSDFHLGYSPERINPGDREHTVQRIFKVVAGDTPEVAAKLAAIYGTVNDGKIFIAKNIKTAEAAKVIENAQRDINIAFINEVTMIFAKIGISIYDVLAAAGTKWNFLPFTPGFVGGHCIGVDPFYLAYLAQKLGHYPEIIVAGRRINDGMGDYVAERISEIIAARSGKSKGARLLVLGLTFKENVPDLRNSKVIDLIEGLRARGHTVDVHEPHADPEEAKLIYGLSCQRDLAALGGYDALIGAVAHNEYRQLRTADFSRLVPSGGVVADIKGMWRTIDMPLGVFRWEL